MICIKNGTLHTAVSKETFIADILIDGGKIVKIGKGLSADGAEVIDATGLHVYPGFVEAHCHIGLDGYGIGYEGHDYNELNDPVTPQVQAIDGINPFDPCMKMAAKAGVTCFATGPGSSNSIGGTFAAIKPVGTRVDNMIVKFPIAMKCAFGENPKRCYQKQGISSRMTNAAKIREALNKAKVYKAKIEAAGDDASKLPAYDQKSEALIPVLNHEIPLKAHAHQANDIFTAIRIAKEFGVGLTLEHVTEGHMIVDELAKENLPLAVGPTFGHASKFELQNKTWETPGILAKAGCHVSIITDAPVTPLHYLPLCAGLAIKAGMDEYEALRAVTINPAEHIGIADRVGSLEEGKDADVVIVDGCPFDVTGVIKHVLINGEEV
ncbi:MAG: amidohydrolase [Candidatus Copromonas sp.]|jgi:imidazolonepropionase-like amidohydrolase|uniref:amidohydrolase n=1 Tax=Desulfotomaculum sp. OF05-3 TaxID=2305243 RepID=UPI0018F6D3B0|nr:amidohydrolase [Desulfotomaculum sp. OF05-3]MDR3780482.1 amidohydrolase [Candidatus Copromonas sp.]